MKVNGQNSPLFAVGLQKWNAFAEAYTGPYDLTGAQYKGMNHKVDFVCPVHGLQQMDAKNMMRGAMCKKCAFAARKGRLRMTQQQMLERFSAVHGDTYGYGYALYTGQRNKVRIQCSVHGFFEQVAEFHWAGAGCPKCFSQDRRGASQRDTMETFTAKLQDLFKGALVCKESAYVNSQTKIEVQCTIHNRLCTSKANWLLTGNNPCPQCNHMKSAGEAAIAALVANYTRVVTRDRTLLKPRELDIYLPERQLAIEYSGMYWHSHFNAADEKKDKRNHFQKYVDCKAQGVRLLTIYETEWLEHQYAVKRLLRNACGKSKGKLMARKCDLRKVPTPEARVFYERYHPQGGAGGGEHYGLYWKNKLVACMRFAFGQNDRGAGAASRTWTLGRYATRITVAGAASRLFNAFLQEHKPAEVKSFSDNRYFEGGMYEQLGFSLAEEVAPDYQVWSPKMGLCPKPHYQRRSIPKRLQEHGVAEGFDPATDPRTEAEMTYLMGAGRVYDCGKKKWVYKPELMVHNPLNPG